jgi:ribose transport system permease protein
MVPGAATRSGGASETIPPARRFAALVRRFQGVLAFLGIVLLAIVLSPHSFDGSNVFLQAGNLTDILQQVSVIGIIAVAMTFVILTAGIDLSVGSILALSTAVTAMVLTRVGPGMAYSSHIALAIVAALTACALVGMVNGFVIARFDIQPFIVTLASMIGIRGLAKWLTANANIDIGFGRDVAAVFAALISRKAVIIGALATVALLFWTVLDRTVFGRYVRAVGDNEKAARYTGLPIGSVKVWVYALSGLMAGLAGVIYAAENHQGNPNAGMGYELDAIAAVIIGGTSLMGGKGSIFGTILGTLILGVLTNMLRLNNVDSNVEMMVKAIIILVAVAAMHSGKSE